MQWLNIILVISGAFGVVAGAGLLFIPEQMPGEQNKLRQWLLERDLSAMLNRYRRIEQPLYRHHHIFGTVVIAGAFILLVSLGKLYMHLFATSASTPLLGIQLAMLAGWALAILTLAIGITLVIRPSALKGIEALSNRWVGPFPDPARRAVLAVNGIKRLRFLRRIGMLLLAVGIACLWVAARMAGA